jgi:hypothetical protein
VYDTQHSVKHTLVGVGYSAHGSVTHEPGPHSGHATIVVAAAAPASTFKHPGSAGVKAVALVNYEQLVHYNTCRMRTPSSVKLLRK